MQMQNNEISRKFGRFFYDLNKYSLKELICNYLVFFGWVVALIIEVINCSIHSAYIKNITEGQIGPTPWLFDRLSRFAFLFLAMTIFGLIPKLIWRHKRLKGNLPSYYETLEASLNPNFNTGQKPKTSWVLKGLYIGLGAAAVVILMLAVWYF